jgi:hypothetical protein
MSHVQRARLFWIGAALFVTSRVAVRLTGARFDLSALGSSWQHLDPVLLQTRLGESLLHLHSQPPVFNAFLGLVLKASGNASDLVFELLFLAMGAGLYLVTYLLMRRLSVSPRIAFIVSTVFALSPSVLLYELWLFYTLPLALLVGLLAVTFARAIERRSWGAYGAFFTVLALLCGLHGIFHLLYVAGCVGALLLAGRGSRIKVVTAAALPLALVVGIYAKNSVLFGQFTTSTWLGMNIALRRVEVLPLEERKRLVAEGQLSDVAPVTPFDPLTSYPAHYAQVPPRFAAIPALADPVKSTGEPNLNHVGYIAIAKSYQADTKQVLRLYPKVLIQSLLRGWYEYFKSSSNYWFVERNLEASWLLRWSNRLFDLLLYGVLLGNTPGLLLIVLIPAMVIYALRVARTPHIVTSLEVSSEQRWLLAFAAGTIAFVAVIANTLNTLENMRIRFMTDPLLAAVLAFWIEWWLWPRLRAGTLFRLRAGGSLKAP